MEIKEYLTIRNYTRGNNKNNKFIVIHYVGAVSTALNNAKYFNSEYRGASANYFIDDNEIYRVVKDEDIAWHCGTNGKYYSDCRNSNSIGIEMCCYKNNGVLDISDNTINKTIELVKKLMTKYNIPIENIIRHYDVTHKICPAPFVNNEARWNDFKSRLGDNTPKGETKSIIDLANEVIAGKYGVGEARKKALGSLYDEVQAEVNKILLGKKPVNNKKSKETIANEVIQGLWGNGADRKNRLTQAGYNYNDIQKIVNQKLIIKK